MTREFSACDFGKRLRDARKPICTQEAAAELLGISHRQYARYESGKSLPSSAMLPIICKTFNVSADGLLGISKEDVV
jgi:transcriptional regulator with XRE-family HTH domain